MAEKKQTRPPTNVYRATINHHPEIGGDATIDQCFAAPTLQRALTKAKNWIEEKGLEEPEILSIGKTADIVI